MALVDPNIALSGKPLQFESPTNMLAQAYQLQNAAQANQLNQMKMAEYERARQEEEGIRNYLQGRGLNAPMAQNELLRFGKTGLEYAKQLQAQQTAALQQRSAQLKFQTDMAEAAGRIYTGVKDQATWDAAKPRLAALGGDASALPAAYDPEFIRSELGQAQSVKDQFELTKPKVEQIKTADRIIFRDTNPRSPTFGQEMLPAEKMGMSPYQQQHLAQMQQRLSAESATGVLTPETLDFAAQVYTQSGNLPPLGIGKGAAQIKAQIMNRAAQIAMGGAAPTPETAGAPGAAPTTPPVSAAAAASNVIGAKQNVAAQSAALKSFNTGVEGRAVRSFNTAIDHLDTMDKLATALNNNDMKAFNSVSQAFASQFGVAAPTNFDAAKAIVGGEVAKALTGANMALKDREEIRDTLNRANSPAQLKGVITTLQHLMGGQLKSLETQYTSSTGRKDFEGKLSKRSKEVVRTLGGETGAAGGAPTPGTVMDGYRFKGGDPANQANWEKL